MNERIQKLYKQAMVKTADMSRPGRKELDPEKFAQLVVKEATNIVLHYTDVDEGVSVAKKHFGLDK
jgi:hypothetical protein